MDANTEGFESFIDLFRQTGRSGVARGAVSGDSRVTRNPTSTQEVEESNYDNNRRKSSYDNLEDPSSFLFINRGHDEDDGTSRFIDNKSGGTSIDNKFGDDTSDTSFIDKGLIKNNEDPISSMDNDGVSDGVSDNIDGSSFINKQFIWQKRRHQHRLDHSSAQHRSERSSRKLKLGDTSLTESVMFEHYSYEIIIVVTFLLVMLCWSFWCLYLCSKKGKTVETVVTITRNTSGNRTSTVYGSRKNQIENQEILEDPKLKEFMERKVTFEIQKHLKKHKKKKDSHHHDDYKSDYKDDYKSDYKDDYKSDYNDDYKSDYKGDYKSDYKDDYKGDVITDYVDNKDRYSELSNSSRHVFYNDSEYDATENIFEETPIFKPLLPEEMRRTRNFRIIESSTYNNYGNAGQEAIRDPNNNAVGFNNTIIVEEPIYTSSMSSSDESNILQRSPIIVNDDRQGTNNDRINNNNSANYINKPLATSSSTMNRRSSSSTINNVLLNRSAMSSRSSISGMSSGSSPQRPKVSQRLQGKSPPRIREMSHSKKEITISPMVSPFKSPSNPISPERVIQPAGYKPPDVWMSSPREPLLYERTSSRSRSPNSTFQKLGTSRSRSPNSAFQKLGTSRSRSPNSAFQKAGCGVNKGLVNGWLTSTEVNLLGRDPFQISPNGSKSPSNGLPPEESTLVQQSLSATESIEQDELERIVPPQKILGSKVHEAIAKFSPGTSPQISSQRGATTIQSKISAKSDAIRPKSHI